MYSNIYTSDQSEVFHYRLERVRQELSQMRLSTKEEYQAAVISRLNRLILMQGQVQPLHEIVKETPALIGDVQANLDILNDDVRAVSSQLLNTEQTAAGLLNLYSATQTALRRRLRQMLFTSTSSAVKHSFVGEDLLDQHTCEVDLAAGVVTLPVASQTALTPTNIRVGAGSEGSLLGTTSLASLVDGQPHTVFEWIGSRLELVFEFSDAVILNRIAIDPHDFDGMLIEEMSCSPDGIYHESALEDIPVEFRNIDAASNKFSGQYVADFAPKETRYLKLVLRDCAGVKHIRLRGISFFSRSFTSNGFVSFKPVQLQQGRYKLLVSSAETEPLTSVQHQLSEDGVKFRVIYPSDDMDLNGPVWYRLYLERKDSKFAKDQNPYLSGLQDLDAGPAFTSTQPTQTVELGGGIYQREIQLDTLTAPIRIKDRVVYGTVTVVADGVLLGSEGFSFSQGILSLKNLPASGIVLRYQTSLADQNSFALRKTFFSPYLYSATFRKIL